MGVQAVRSWCVPEHSEVVATHISLTQRSQSHSVRRSNG